MGDKRVSRMAAVLVEAAGGEIRVPLRLINDADIIELEQIDRPGSGYVIYRTRYGGRAAPGASRIVDAEFDEVREALPGQPRQISDNSKETDDGD